MWNRLLRKLLGEEEGLAPRSTFKRSFQVLMMFLLFVIGFFFVALVSIAVAMMYTDTTGFRVDGPNFPLYKNTIFEQCSSSIPRIEVNCTTLFWTRLPDYNFTDRYRWIQSFGIDSPERDEFGVQVRDDSATENGAAIYGWCDLMSCLKDYKIIPSRPRPIAFGFQGYNRLQMWGWLCVSAFGGVWFLRNALIGIHRPQESSNHILRRRYDHDHPEEASSPTPSVIELQMAEGTCQGLGIVDWLSWICDIGMSGLWIYSYLEAIGDRYNIAPVNTLAWITPWRVTVGLFNHPFACHHPHSNRSYHPSRTRLARVVTSVMIMITIVYWILCVHLTRVEVQVRGSKHPVYQCLESEILQAPGATVCTPQLLCSKEKQWLFANYSWNSSVDTAFSKKSIDVRYRAVFFLSSIAAWAALGFWIANQFYCKGKWYRWEFKWRRALNGTVMVSLVYLIIMSAVDGAFVLEEVFAYNSGSKAPRQAIVAYDVNCTAAHVYMSDWRYCLDVDGYNRATRIARMLLNS